MIQVKVLLVDDESGVRVSLKENLENLNWTIDTAENGASALHLLKKSKYDLVICDVCMPIMNGYQLLHSFRCFDLDTPFIFMSGFNAIPIWDCFAGGAHGLIGKPFQLEDLSVMATFALQPKSLRWKDTSRVAQNLIIHSHIQMEWDESMTNLSFGRGGMFINPRNVAFNIGQIVSFSIGLAKGAIEGIGKVHWRRGLQYPLLSQGCGIEFFFLEEPFRSRIVTAIGESQEVAYIPKGAQTTILLA